MAMSQFGSIPRSSMPQDHIRMSYGTVAEYVDVLWGKEEGQ